MCHFVTPLDGSVEVDEHRRPEVLGIGPSVAGKDPSSSGGSSSPRAGSGEWILQWGSGRRSGRTAMAALLTSQGPGCDSLRHSPLLWLG